MYKHEVSLRLIITSRRRWGYEGEDPHDLNVGTSQKRLQEAPLRRRQSFVQDKVG
jgi:hypothetical protein